MARAVYRLNQFWDAVTARPLPAAAWRDVTATLSPAEHALFERYERDDRRHCHAVWRTLRAAGLEQPQLLAAALLHDVGKSRVRLTVLERALAVLGCGLVPGQAAAWGQGEARGWRRPFVVRQKHPQWGAEMAAAAGSHPLTVRLIECHQEKRPFGLPADELGLLQALQWADDQN